MASDEKRILHSTMTTASMTALSRIMGYIRDRVVASLLGTSYLADAFYIAFRIPNTFRRFVAEGAMTASLVPVLSHAFQKDGEESAWLFARRFLYVFGTFLAVFGAAGTLAAPWIVRVMAWEFKGKAPQVYELTVHLAALLFPYITLVSLSAVAMGILNCRDIFGPSAFTPVLLNISIITAGLLWGRNSQNPTEALAWGVLVGGALQFLYQVPYLKKAGMSLAPAFSIADERVRKVFSLMLPGMLGAGVGQLTILAGTVMAHLVGEGAVSALYYSNRVTELAFGIFAVSLSTVILPRMSRQVSEDDKEGIAGTLGQALSMVFFILLPASAGIVGLSRPIVEVLFKTGQFDAHSVGLTEGPLVAYTLGMVPWGAALILVRVCHAHKDMYTPFYAGLATLVSYLVVAVSLMPSMAASGIALASSITALINIVWVAVALKSRHGVDVPYRQILASFLRSALLSAAMGAGVFFLHGAFSPQGKLRAAAWLFGVIGAGAIFYGAAGILLKFPEIRPFLEYARRWRRRGAGEPGA